MMVFFIVGPIGLIILVAVIVIIVALCSGESRQRTVKYKTKDYDAITKQMAHNRELYQRGELSRSAFQQENSRLMYELRKLDNKDDYE